MTFDIRDYGALGDGKTINTNSFQNAIDYCASHGGGKVLVTDGIYTLPAQYFCATTFVYI